MKFYAPDLSMLSAKLALFTRHEDFVPGAGGAALTPAFRLLSDVSSDALCCEICHSSFLHLQSTLISYF